MSRSKFFRMAGVAILILVTLMGSGEPALADTSPDVTYDLPSGAACDFAVRIEIYGSNKVVREWLDENNQPVRTFMGGTGSIWKFIAATGKTLTIDPKGSVTHITYNPDGTQTWATTGHSVLILFPTDIPAGPSTTLYVGRVVFTVAADGVFTLQKTSGQATDLCAALS
jgi:hypothetical protein